MATLEKVKAFTDQLITDRALRDRVIKDVAVEVKKELGLDGQSLLSRAQADRIDELDIQGASLLRRRLVELDSVLESWSAATAAVIYADGCQTPYRGGYAIEPNLPSARLDWTAPDEIIRSLEIAATQADSRLGVSAFLFKAAEHPGIELLVQEKLKLLAANLE